MDGDHHTKVNNLCDAFLLLKSRQEVFNFLKDLCTPQEITAMAERLWVCQLLNKGDLSYRDIHRITGASLTTIGRVSRFLKEEPHKGYETILKRMP